MFVCANRNGQIKGNCHSIYLLYLYAVPIWKIGSDVLMQVIAVYEAIEQSSAS